MEEKASPAQAGMIGWKLVRPANSRSARGGKGEMMWKKGEDGGRECHQDQFRRQPEIRYRV